MSNLQTEDITTRLRINPVTKTIAPKYRTSKDVYVSKGDHNSVYIAFEMPRYVDGFDMASEENVIHIHYANIDSKDETKYSKGVSDAVNVKTETDETGDEIVVFSWLIPNTATKYAGVLSIGVTFERYENVNNKVQEVYSWSTAPYGKIIVWDSMDNDAIVVEREYDYLVATCNAIVETAIKREFRKEIETALAEAKESGEFKGEDGLTPYISDNGNWWIGTTDTGVKAKGVDGKDGITPTLSIDTDGNLYVKYDEAPPTLLGNIKGKNGTSVTVTSVSESEDDSGNNVVTFSDGKTVTIKNGSKGTGGKDGYTPYIQDDYWYINGNNTGVKAIGKDGKDGVGITKIETEPNTAFNGGYYVNIHLSNGEITSFNIMNGNGIHHIESRRNDSDNGTLVEMFITDGEIASVEIPDGKDGYTPVKGTDYFTPADKQEIVTEVINTLPKYNGGVS